LKSSCATKNKKKKRNQTRQLQRVPHKQVPTGTFQDAISDN
jgi:hypothetical protein